MKNRSDTSKTLRLRDLAKATGLSLATISKVLNDKVGVSSQAREKVQQAISTLGFEKRKRLSDDKNISTVTLIAYSMAAYGGAFYDQIIRAILEEGATCGLLIEVHLLMLPQHVSDISDTALFPNGKPEALILLGIDHFAVLNRVVSLGCPTLLVNGMDPYMRIDSISPDYFLGGFLATQHLLDLGHRAIVHVGTSRRTTLDLRRQGFVFALNCAGISYDPKHHLIDIGQRDFALINEETLFERVLPSGKPLGSAFFAVADTAAMSIVQTLITHGFSVPHDISVVGFDDLPVSAHYLPPLTTLNSKRAAIGQTAIHMLLERAKAPQKSVSRINVGVDLVIRESTQRLSPST